MGLLLYGGLGLLPIWVMVGYALLAPAGAPAHPSPVVLWLSVGAVPACFMTLMFAEAIMVTRERRRDPWRQQKIVLIALPLLMLFYAAGITWEQQAADRRAELQRMLRLVAAHPEVVAWIGRDVQPRVFDAEANPDLLAQPLRFWLRAGSGRREVVAVVSADRALEPAHLRVVCIERHEGGATPHTQDLCKR
jgi:hypothetical protein